MDSIAGKSVNTLSMFLRTRADFEFPEVIFMVHQLIPTVNFIAVVFHRTDIREEHISIGRLGVFADFIDYFEEFRMTSSLFNVMVVKAEMRVFVATTFQFALHSFESIQGESRGNLHQRVVASDVPLKQFTFLKLQSQFDDLLSPEVIDSPEAFENAVGVMARIHTVLA